ncbi:MAG: hypothetical protein QM632_00145 [Micrococcaceae bacterium]
MNFSKLHKKIYKTIFRYPADSCEKDIIYANCSRYSAKKIDHAIEELVRSKFIASQGEGFKILDPHDAVNKNNLKMTRTIAELQALDHKNREFYSQLLEIYKDHSAASRESTYRILTSIHETQDILIKLGLQAQEKVEVMNVPPGFGLDQITMSNPDLLKNLDPNVRIRRIVTKQSFSEDQLTMFTKVFTGVKHTLKIADTIPLQLQIYDNQYTILASTQFPRNSSAFFFKDPLIAQFALSIFDTKWHKAELFDPFSKDYKTEKDPERHQIFKLLLQEGLSDHDVREQLGLTPKMFRSRIQKYSKQIDAMNRSQLDAFAFKNGWHLD